MNSFIDLAYSHQKRVIDAFDQREKAEMLFFRVMGPKLQHNLHRMMNLDEVPHVFLHGNPHIDNYARTMTGAGMVDFDRSRLGPYAWDIIRFLGSLSMRLPEDVRKGDFCPKESVDTFFEAYLSSLKNPDLHFSVPHFMSAINPKKEELSMSSYLSAGVKWAKKMRKNPLPADDKKIKKLLDGFLQSREDEGLLKIYEISEAGKSPGSLGKMHYIIALKPKDASSGRDHVLLDIKECYEHDDDENFTSPFAHNGIRMIKASNLYAPGVEQRLGYLTFDGKHFWGRQVPAFKAKVASSISKQEAADLAYCVGQQLGRAHRRSCKEFEPKIVEKHFRKHFDQMLHVSEYINRELKLSLDFLRKSHELQVEFGLPEAYT